MRSLVSIQSRSYLVNQKSLSFGTGIRQGWFLHSRGVGFKFIGHAGIGNFAQVLPRVVSISLLNWQGIFFLHWKHSRLCTIIIPCREITKILYGQLSPAPFQPEIHWFPIWFLKVQNEADQFNSTDVTKACPIICIINGSLPDILSWPGHNRLLFR